MKLQNDLERLHRTKSIAKDTIRILESHVADGLGLGNHHPPLNVFYLAKGNDRFQMVARDR